jgi:hypothetical protein
MTKTIFQCARLRFKLAVEAGLSPAEGVAIQIFTENEERIIFEDSAIRGGNPVAKISSELVEFNSLKKKFQIEAIVIATELDEVTGDTIDPCAETIKSIKDLVATQTQNKSSEAPIFIVYGHADNDYYIREMNLTL